MKDREEQTTGPESGSYTFKPNPAPPLQMPLMIDGPIEELKNLSEGLSFTIAQCAQLNMPLLAASLLRWQDKIQEVVKDQLFEYQKYQAPQDSGGQFLGNQRDT